MKKIIATVLAFVMLLGTVAIGVPEEGIRLDFGLRAFAASEVASGICGDNLTWVLDSEGTLAISGSGEMYDWGTLTNRSPWYRMSSIKNVVINGASSIGAAAFYVCGELNKVTISGNIKSIGDNAFGYCSNLTNIELPEAVESIGDYAFEFCSKLIAISMPETMDYIGKGCFYMCRNLASIDLPNGIESIGEYSFYNSGLLGITIPEGVENIKSNAFNGCQQLGYAEIPDSLLNIADDAFDRAFALSRFTVGENNKKYSSVEGVLFNKDASELIAYPPRKETASYRIPDGVKVIGSEAFFYAEFTELTIPVSVTSIAADAFEFNRFMKQINVESGNDAYCSINGVLFDKGIKTILKFPALARENNGNDYTLPGTVTTIGNGAFNYVYLDTLNIPDGVKTIADKAFYMSRIDEIILPDSVSAIGEHAFAYSRIKYINLPDGIEAIKEYAYDSSSLVSIDLPDSVLLIEREAFGSCDDLQSIYISSNLSTVAFAAFSGSDQLENVYYDGTPESWDNITVGSFNDNLTDANIHFIRRISDSTGKVSAFVYRDDAAVNSDAMLSARQITTSATEEGNIWAAVSSLGSSVMLYDISIMNGSQMATPSKSFVLRLPIPDGAKYTDCRVYRISDGGSVEELTSLCVGQEFQITTQKQGYYAVVASDSANKCGDNATWSLNDDGTLVISGSGPVYDYDYAFEDEGTGCVPWLDKKNRIKKIVVEDGITIIGRAVFSSCLTSEISLPKTVIEIRDDLDWCYALGWIDVAADNPKYYSINGVLFDRGYLTSKEPGLICYPSCKPDSTYSVPEGTVKISSEFTNSYLNEIYIPASVEYCYMTLNFGATLGYIDVAEDNQNFSDIDGVLFNKDKTELITYPPGKTQEAYKVPDSVLTLANSSFLNAESLKTVEIPNSVMSISGSVFANCYGLKTVYLSGRITGIASCAFDGFTMALDDVYYTGTQEDWNGIEIAQENDGLLNARIHFALEIEDETTGVLALIDHDDSNLDSTTKLNVSKVSDIPAEDSAVADAVEQFGDKCVLYDIFLTKNGAEIQPSESITLKIPVPEGYDPDKCRIYHVSENGYYTDMDALPFDGYLLITVDHFSYYAVVEGEAPAPARLPGDINSDGKISLLDSTILRRYLAGWNGVTISESNADVNGDGEVTLLDSTILRRYLAGWEDVELQ